VRVSAADLDLATTKGVNTLYARIYKAAKAYCADLNSLTGSRLVSGTSSCVTDAVANTVKGLNVPALSALHAEKSRTSTRS
jgi:UrcA family protein